jgi:hypothetical protein
MQMLSLRGHHLSHLARYLHTGEIRYSKSPDFTAMVVSLFDKIKNDTTLRISVVSTLDSVCKGCEINEEEKRIICSNGSYQDNIWILLFGLNKNGIYNQRRLTNIVYNAAKKYWI